MDISEKNFEDTIESVLLSAVSTPLTGSRGEVRERSDYAASDFLAGGYHKRTSEEYNQALCLLAGDTLEFIYATQLKEWGKFKGQFTDEREAQEKFFQRLSQELHKRGTLEVLRKGIKSNGSHFDFAYYRPASTLNSESQGRYAANIFSVVRQLHYSNTGKKDNFDISNTKNQKSLDIVLFLNGLPIFTAELKNQLTGQNAKKDALRQYREDRDPHEPFFAFGRCLAHFAIDPDNVYMTTHLQGLQTSFLPFNQGRDKGAGNPVSHTGFATAYLWKHIWARDSVLDLVQHFIQNIEEEDDKGKKTGKHRLLFPRYHQIDCVRRLLGDARRKGPGQRYLIQHSAGSGKSNSISWLAHQLSILHDESNTRVFDSIIVVTDRRVLDKQLQRTVRQFEQTHGIVENIDTTSRKLKEALEHEKIIIVTTLQKFPVIAKEIGALPGKRFAVIIDEAHSSQSGSSTDSLKQVLAVRDLTEAEREESEEPQDAEDLIVKEVKMRGRLPNVSYFAFTATPKAKTLELFGERQADGSYAPFSLYTMRQAIEEGFILDVLQNYVTYKAYWSLLKKVEQNPNYPRTKAAYILRAFVDLNEHTIASKVAIIVEHFAGQTAPCIGGKAKAMIVTRSRLHAVRYKQALDSYLQEHGYAYKTLVAFSGTVHDGGIDYTEANMNGGAESHTAETFKQDAYRFLVVANKFQTGFDQPLLHTMYVDKKLGGVNAVQTLSRLNRVYASKQETMVLDFANDAEDIQASFAPYYEMVKLNEGTDPNLLYDLQTRMANFSFYTQAEANSFAAIYRNPKATADQLHAALEPALECYREAVSEEQVDFRGQLTDYVRLYSFLKQIITFVDTDLENLSIFSKLLLKKLPTPDDHLPSEIQQYIDIDSYRLQETHKGMIALSRQAGELEPMRSKRTYLASPEEMEPLSQIIEELNSHFGGDFTQEDTVCIQELEERLTAISALQASIHVNSRENARLSFDEVVKGMMQGMMEGHFKFYKHVNDDDEFARFFLALLFDRYSKKEGQQSA